VTVPAEAVKVALVAPVVTATEAGTVRTPEAELVIVTLVPAAAAWLSVMVQVVDVLEARELAAHCKELTVIRVVNEMLAC
jgi:hypothetical protein